jgi:hypothetical protein
VVVWNDPTLEYAVINPSGNVVKQLAITEENGQERNVTTTSVPNGVFVAWTESNESGSVVKATRIGAATNEPGSIFNVNTDPSESVYALHVAANPTGDVIASWAAENSVEHYEANVRSAIVPAGTTAATQEVVVELTASYTESSAPYIYPNGEGGVAAIANAETGPAQLIVTPMAATGEPGSTYVVPTTGGAQGPSVATNAAGNAYLTWVEQVSGTPRAVTTELTGLTTPHNAETLLTPVSPNSTFATINASGELILATWNSSDDILRSYIRPTLSTCAAGTYSVTGNEPCTAAQPGSYVATSEATTRTPTETRTPPVIAAGGGGLPSNTFTIDGYTRGKNGTITLTIDLPGPGSVSVLGTHSDQTNRADTASALLQPGDHRLVWTRHSATASKAGRMRITLHPNTAGARMLGYHRRHGWALHVREWTTYTPTGGHARSAAITIRVLTAGRR